MTILHRVRNNRSDWKRIFLLALGRLRAPLGVVVTFNVTSGRNETVEMNRTTWSWINVTLADGRTWSQPYTFAIDVVGLWKVQFLLFKGSDVSAAYRVHLFVRVS